MRKLKPLVLLFLSSIPIDLFTIGLSAIIVGLFETKISITKVTPYTIKQGSFSYYNVNNAILIDDFQKSLDINDNQTAVGYVYLKNNEDNTTQNFTIIVRLEGNFEGELMLGLGYFSNSQQCLDFINETGLNVTHLTSSSVYYLCPFNLDSDPSYRLCSSLPCEVRLNVSVSTYKRVFPFVKVYSSDDNYSLVMKTFVLTYS